MTSKSYMEIVKHYEDCLNKFGDTHKGVDWPNQEDVFTRYRVMLEVIRNEASNPVTLLDFGCGASHLYEYMLKNNINNIEYSGADISTDFIELSRKKFPDVQYYCLDILEDDSTLPQFDYIVMNGVFTEKRSLSFDEMLTFFKAMVKKVFPHATKGIAFNVMAKQVDWELDFLFHLPLDVLANFLTKEVTRNFVIRFDYQLYEYTVYVYQ